MGAYSRLGAVLTFSVFRTGAYSRWVLIRGWVLIRINTVYVKSIVEGQAIPHGENLSLSKKLLKQVSGFGYQLRLKVGRNITLRGF